MKHNGPRWSLLRMGGGHVDCSLYLMFEIFRKTISQVKKKKKHKTIFICAMSFCVPKLPLCPPYLSPLKPYASIPLCTLYPPPPPTPSQSYSNLPLDWDIPHHPFKSCIPTSVHSPHLLTYWVPQHLASDCLPISSHSLLTLGWRLL